VQVEREEEKMDIDGLIREACGSIRRIRALNGGIIPP